MVIWRMRITCWITKAINTNSEYVILNPSYLLFFPENNVCMKAPQGTLILSLTVILVILLSLVKVLSPRVKGPLFEADH
jgi:hypothetical protein